MLEGGDWVEGGQEVMSPFRPLPWPRVERTVACTIVKVVEVKLEEAGGRMDSNRRKRPER